MGRMTTVEESAFCQNSSVIGLLVVAEKATAEYRNGVLTVTLPKAPSAQRPVHRIAVKSG